MRQIRRTCATLVWLALIAPTAGAQGETDIDRLLCVDVTSQETTIVQGVFGKDTIGVCYEISEEDYKPVSVLARRMTAGKTRPLKVAAGAAGQTPFAVELLMDGPNASVRRLWFAVATSTYVFEWCNGRTCDAGIRMWRFENGKVVMSGRCVSMRTVDDDCDADKAFESWDALIAETDATRGLVATSKFPKLIRIAPVPANLAALMK